MNNVELLTAEQVAELDPGVRLTVQWLRDNGFDTCDSGDGSKASTMECALPYANVTMLVSSVELVAETNRLRTLLFTTGIDLMPMNAVDQPCVSGSFDPVDGIAVIMLFGVNDTILRDAMVNGAQRRLASQEQLRVYEETRGMRARANAAVLDNGDDDDV